MVDEPMGEESFAELFERSEKVVRREVRPGEKVSGRVVQVGAERALVDLGDGIDAMMELTELSEKGEAPQVKVGDRVEAFVVRLEDRLPILAKKLGRGAGARAALEEAARTGIPVDGTVTEVNKGGYVVEVAGVSGFCPLGQMDVRRIEDPATMIGSKLSFRVQELRAGRQPLLSRRALLEEEQAARAAKTRAKLEPGARFTGTVTSVRDFGAFVDLGGLEGLVPASEIGHGRLRPADVVRSGQSVEVQILKIEPPGPKDRSERITLSMRALAEDPWDRTMAEVGVGSVVRGTVVRIQPFGAFVEIVPGVEGLLHVSAFGRRIAQPSDVVTVGDSIAVQVDEVDPGRRRISLSYVDPADLVEEAAEPTPEPTVVEAAPLPVPAPKPVHVVTARALPPGPGLRVRRTEKPAAAEERTARPAAAVSPGPAPVEKKARVLTRSSPSSAPPARVGPSAGQVVDVTVDKVEPFGLLVTWGPHRGLIPGSEVELPKGADLKKAFPAGTVLKAAITEVRGDGKIRLSVKAAAEAEERAEARSWMKAQSGPKAGFGTLGDLLKNKLGQ